uniref:Uncharacterized protein n=1 Tax=Chromera velia CCMP2878 TaxID=1169474 RepID=A0A0G4HZB7_9ALVE|eukprot:Cvel_9697.t1-p1 / transcript=Cvel_9697.t1 / gene=Cvel_9697 / organism=Chromera_velia_CCMP2878 / gene_product=hypothetical protein / transcript_product=hypothetical protein / location=Cvel_scaffold565:35165-39651(+) / protein_length=1053 / sequence_SO=supercontig / SO=protein_coding / is_pseudo=false
MKVIFELILLCDSKSETSVFSASICPHVRVKHRDILSVAAYAHDCLLTVQEHFPICREGVFDVYTERTPAGRDCFFCVGHLPMETCPRLRTTWIPLTVSKACPARLRLFLYEVRTPPFWASPSLGEKGAARPEAPPQPAPPAAVVKPGQGHAHVEARRQGGSSASFSRQHARAGETNAVTGGVRGEETQGRRPAEEAPLLPQSISRRITIKQEPGVSPPAPVSSETFVCKGEEGDGSLGGSGSGALMPLPSISTSSRQSGTRASPLTIQAALQAQGLQGRHPPAFPPAAASAGGGVRLSGEDREGSQSLPSGGGSFPGTQGGGAGGSGSGSFGGSGVLSSSLGLPGMHGGTNRQMLGHHAALRGAGQDGETGGGMCLGQMGEEEDAEGDGGGGSKGGGLRVADWISKLEQIERVRAEEEKRGEKGLKVRDICKLLDWHIVRMTEAKRYITMAKELQGDPRVDQDHRAKLAQVFEHPDKVPVKIFKHLVDCLIFVCIQKYKSRPGEGDGGLFGGSHFEVEGEEGGGKGGVLGIGSGQREGKKGGAPAASSADSSSVHGGGGGRGPLIMGSLAPRLESHRPPLHHGSGWGRSRMQTGGGVPIRQAASGSSLRSSVPSVSVRDHLTLHRPPSVPRGGDDGGASPRTGPPTREGSWVVGGGVERHNGGKERFDAGGDVQMQDDGEAQDWRASGGVKRRRPDEWGDEEEEGEETVHPSRPPQPPVPLSLSLGLSPQTRAQGGLTRPAAPPHPSHVSGTASMQFPAHPSSSSFSIGAPGWDPPNPAVPPCGDASPTSSPKPEPPLPPGMAEGNEGASASFPSLQQQQSELSANPSSFSFLQPQERQGQGQICGGGEGGHRQGEGGETDDRRALARWVEGRVMLQPPASASASSSASPAAAPVSGGTAGVGRGDLGVVGGGSADRPSGGTRPPKPAQQGKAGDEIGGAAASAPSSSSSSSHVGGGRKGGGESGGMEVEGGWPGGSGLGVGVGVGEVQKGFADWVVDLAATEEGAELLSRLVSRGSARRQKEQTKQQKEKEEEQEPRDEDGQGEGDREREV